MHVDIYQKINGEWVLINQKSVKDTGINRIGTLICKEDPEYCEFKILGYNDKDAS